MRVKWPEYGIERKEIGLLPREAAEHETYGYHIILQMKMPTSRWQRLGRTTELPYLSLHLAVFQLRNVVTHGR